MGFEQFDFFQHRIAGATSFPAICQHSRYFIFLYVWSFSIYLFFFFCLRSCSSVNPSTPPFVPPLSFEHYALVQLFFCVLKSLSPSYFHSHVLNLFISFLGLCHLLYPFSFYPVFLRVGSSEETLTLSLDLDHVIRIQINRYEVKCTLSF